jgi:hypothetical protein
MKIIIAGSRDVTDYEVVRQAVIESGYWKLYGKSIEVICGMALSWQWDTDPVAGGVDRWGYEFAQRNGLIVHPFHADWKRYGKRAGFIRNALMGDYAFGNEGRLLAVWDGESKGTKGMIDYARTIGLKGFVYRTDKMLRYDAQVGMKVKTDFSGKITHHTIVEIDRTRQSQSGVMFTVQPPVPKSGGKAWIDADWFETT